MSHSLFKSKSVLSENLFFHEKPVDQAFLTEATRSVDIIHISLTGMTLIVLVLLAAVALPVFGYLPVSDSLAFAIMSAAAILGIVYLYFVNYRVHKHVSAQARLTEVLVNSLGQGFLTFNEAGVCGTVYSQACLDLLEMIPAQRNIIDVLRIPETQHADFKDWVQVLFMANHALSFEEVVKFLPQQYLHSKERYITLQYKPIKDKAGILVQVVLIATDQTEEREAQIRIQQQQNFADMICRIFKERNQFYATLTHIRKYLSEARLPVPRHEASSLLRSLHTLKATVKHFYLESLGEIIGKLETDLRLASMGDDVEFRRCLDEGNKEMEQALVDVLNQVRDLIGQDYEGKGNMHEVKESVLYDFAHDMRVNNIDKKLIDSFLENIVAVPAYECFRRFERELRDVAEVTGKQIKPVRFTGSNPRVLTRPLHEFLFSLTHISRNVIDHGIEPSVTRLARGKDPAGQISVHIDIIPMSHDTEKKWLHIVISDDGNGIDPSKIRDKLAILDPHGTWRDEQDQAIIQHIFSWGFSTRDKITEYSGRGVGLEVVDREVKALGGTITVFSELYHGTRFEIRIPHPFELKV